MKGIGTMERKIPHFLAAFHDRQLWLYASGACYHILLSLIPASLLLFSLLSVLPVGGMLAELTAAVLPEDIYALLCRLTGLVQRQRSIPLLSVSGALAIWSSSRGMLAIQAGLDHMMGCTAEGGYLLRRLRAICALLPLVVMLVLLLLIELLEQSLLPALSWLVPGIASLLSALLNHRWLSGFFLLSLLSALVYYAVPSVHSPVPACLLVGGLTALVWQLFSVLFSIYMSQISSYPALYGTAGAAFLSLIWLQSCIRVLLWGGRLLTLLPTAH